jgi:hypothetical protein
MTEAINEELPREDVSVEQSAGTPAPDDLDSLLAEFDAKVAAQPKSATDESSIGGTNTTDQNFDQTLADLLRSSEEQQRIEQLTGEIGNLRSAELDRQSKADFEGFSAKLQQELGPNVPDDYAKTQLLAMSVERPELQVAWQYRHLTNEQRAAADLEFRQLEALYWKAQRAPDDPRKAEALAQMERRGQELGLMNAGKILDKAWRDVQRRAEKALPPIDPDVTATRMELAQIIRDGGSNRQAPPEPPVQLGRLTDSEYRQHLLEKYGIAGF